MEKYSNISKITEQYLHGKLQKLIMEYETPEELSVSVLYEDHNDYWYDYQMIVNAKNQQIEFLRHQPEGKLNHIDLLRDKEFENAVLNYLFKPLNLRPTS